MTPPGPAAALQLRSPAKLNLFLHITGRRDDGYHLLQTVFQLLDFGDDVQLSATDDGLITLECPGVDVATQDNLAFRAAAALQARSGSSAGAHIRIEKRIPAGGGLGGGSSNAATVLLGLNSLWQTGLSSDELADIGLHLGADVPVFVRGHSAWAEGVGEAITPVQIPPRHYLVVAPACSVSTAEVFRHRELTRNSAPITIAAFFAGGGRNDCESVVRQLYPEVDNALNFLENFGTARLTGTGGCVFLTLDSASAAAAVQAQLPSAWRSFTAAGVDRSPALDALN
ncbi:MAG: 4-(cytidine 5'-diphospho)-2-C-methyl-D-erythritol kinase [Halieaceae bacterium]|jgi:4-diphosphocytidyl-2-C-methyl-D-erythritol kinase|nr:4-(cytidine 5'-diphospho)-2-C-methyl-D-erythritol kinase [Halieaceae bacterium]